MSSVQDFHWSVRLTALDTVDTHWFLSYRLLVSCEIYIRGGFPSSLRLLGIGSEAARTGNITINSVITTKKKKKEVRN